MLHEKNRKDHWPELQRQADKDLGSGLARMQFGFIYEN